MQNSLFPAAPVVEQVQSVSRVVDYIRRIISQNRTLAGLRVRGEVSGFVRHASGRMYFDLKEGVDVLKCVAWASDAMNLPAFKDGDEIIAAGDFGTFSQRSQYQLFVKSIELWGVGILFAQIEALKKKFREEGLFDAARKRPMPEFPRRAAVVSSIASKGIEDFLATIKTRAPYLDVEFIETRVQGEGAQMDIAEAIDRASKMDVDVIIVARGGGSYEDLFPFSLEPVVRAIARARHPVVSAIGHEGDHPLSDDVADLRCETPSNAAQYFGQISDRFLAQVDGARVRLQHALAIILNRNAQRFDYARAGVLRALRDNLRDREQRLRAVEHRLDGQTPQRRLSERRERLTRMQLRLQQNGAHAVTRAEGRLAVLQARLAGANPEALLERGYAIVTFEGHAVRDAGAVPLHATIEAKVQRGRLQARVEKQLPDG